MKRTPLKRSTKPIKRTKRVNPASVKRKAQQGERRAVRRAVLERDPICRYPECTAESTDAHEIHRGSMRAMTYLDIEQIKGLCRQHHDYVTGNPQAAHDLGLALWSWE